MAFPVNNQILRDAVQRRGWPYPADDTLHIWGCRGAVPYTAPGLLTLKDNVVDEWNDTIGVFGTAFGMWRGTVDPGLPYTQDPLNAQGCAHLQDGRWEYMLGDHKGHEALVQAAPVTVWRDLDEDSGQDALEVVETGWFGINIHAGTGAHVGEWSAGCQVVFSDNGWSGPQWTEFLETVKASPQATWYYFLLSAADLAA
jgi:hypothetical protein